MQFTNTTEDDDQGIIFGGGDTDFDTAYGQKDDKDVNGGTHESEPQASFMKGVLIWMMFNRGCYFWMKALFQMIAFSFLIITVIMLIQFESDYWKITLYVLILKHIIDFSAYNIDLISFSRRNLDCMKYKVSLDVISIAASVIFCVYFVRSFTENIVSQE